MKDVLGGPFPSSASEAVFGRKQASPHGAGSIVPRAAIMWGVNLGSVGGWSHCGWHPRSDGLQRGWCCKCLGVQVEPGAAGVVHGAAWAAAEMGWPPAAAAEAACLSHWKRGSSNLATLEPSAWLVVWVAASLWSSHVGGFL